MMIPKNIKHIIFDLGGVILNIDYQLTSQAFKKLGVDNFDALYSQAQQSHLFDNLETGKISGQTFIAEILKLTNKQIDPKDIETAWNAMLLDMPQNRIDKIGRLRSEYDIYLLSNTNEIHIKAFTRILEDSGQWNQFKALFDGLYYSSSIGERKPNKSAFMHIINQHGLDPQSTMFIDDSIQHVEGARSVGIYAHHLTQEEDIVDLL